MVQKNPLSSADIYALVVFHNIGIDGILEKEELIEDFVKVHDESGSAIMYWTNPGKPFPAEKSYFQMLDEGELKVKDWVYRLIIRHSYEGELPFVVEITKNKFTPRKAKNPLVDRTNSLFPDFEPVLQPSY
jgi:hypothetical protein